MAYDTERRFAYPTHLLTQSRRISCSAPTRWSPQIRLLAASSKDGPDQAVAVGAGPKEVVTANSGSVTPAPRQFANLRGRVVSTVRFTVTSPAALTKGPGPVGSR